MSPGEAAAKAFFGVSTNQAVEGARKVSEHGDGRLLLLAEDW